MDPFRNHRDRTQGVPANFYEQQEAKRAHLEMREVELREQLNYLTDRRWDKIRRRLSNELETAINRLVEPLDEVKTAELRGQIRALQRIIGIEALIGNDLKITTDELQRCIRSLDSASS